jgi:hypothetical protein
LDALQQEPFREKLIATHFQLALVMTATPLHEIIPVLQVAIGPVILISGVGLLLLTMTNRLGRAIDRARQMSGELDESPAEKVPPLQAQVDIIYRRAWLLRLCIVLAVTSALLASVLIITLFLTALFQWEGAVFVSVIFIGCMASLVGSLVVFICDIQLSLTALKLELKARQPS